MTNRTTTGPVRARRSGRPYPAVTVAAACLVFSGWTTFLSWPIARQAWWVDVPMHAFGSAAVLVGAVVWARTPLHRVGALIMAVGAAYHLGDLRAATQPVLFAAGFCLGYAWLAVLVHLILAWPDGRLTDRPARVLVPLSYASAIGSQVLRYAVDSPRGPMGYDRGTDPTWASRTGSILVIVLGAVIIGLVARRWVTSSGVRRRPSGPFWAAASLVGAPVLGLATSAAVGAPAQVQFALTVGALVLGLFLVPVVYLVRLVRTATAQVRLAGIGLSLDRGTGTTVSAVQLEHLLAEALGDPGLSVVYRRPDGTDVDTGGDLVPPDPGPGRIRTPVYRGDRLLCSIIHDDALRHQPEVVRAVAATAGLAIERAELYDQQRRQIAELGESRRRVAQTAMGERRRIRKHLHDDGQQLLYAVLAHLSTAGLQLKLGPDGAAPAEITLRRAHTQLREAVDRLRDIIDDVYPVALSDQGLAAAIEERTYNAPVAVEARIPARRWSTALEQTAYFLITDALTNVYKHAGARQVRISVHDHPDRLTIVVTDDGTGIADPDAPPRSLLDRVGAVGGRLAAGTVRPHGTRITADLPKELT